MTVSDAQQLPCCIFMLVYGCIFGFLITSIIHDEQSRNQRERERERKDEQREARDKDRATLDHIYKVMEQAIQSEFRGFRANVNKELDQLAFDRRLSKVEAHLNLTTTQQDK